MTRKTISMYIVLLLIALLVSSCTKEKKEQMEKVNLRIKWLPGATYVADYVAKDKGFWQESGLDITVNPGGFELDSIKLVASGSDQFGVTGADQLLLAREQGIPVVAIAAIMQRSPVGWISKKGSGIKTPYDFIGKKVGAKYGTNTEIVFDALIKKLEIDSSKIKRIPVKFNIIPFLTGQVDVLPGFITGESVMAEKKGVEVNIIDPSDYGINLYGNVYFTTEEMIKEKPQIVALFLRGVLKAWRWVIENPEESIDILLKFDQKLDTGTELPILENTISLFKPKGVENFRIGWMEKKLWEETMDLLVSQKVMKKRINISSAYTIRFLKEVYKD